MSCFAYNRKNEKEIAKRKVQLLTAQQTLNLDMRISGAFNQTKQTACKKQMASAEAIKKKDFKNLFKKHRK